MSDKDQKTLERRKVPYTDLYKGANLIYNEVKRKLEDTKTVVFITVTAVNIFLWGLLLAEYRNTTKELETLQDKHELTQVMINKYIRGNKDE